MVLLDEKVRAFVGVALLPADTVPTIAVAIRAGVGSRELAGRVRPRLYFHDEECPASDGAPVQQHELSEDPLPGYSRMECSRHQDLLCTCGTGGLPWRSIQTDRLAVLDLKQRLHRGRWAQAD